jgi:hypothetical protein
MFCMDSAYSYLPIGHPPRRFTAHGWLVTLLSLLVVMIGTAVMIVLPGPVAGATPIPKATASDEPEVSGVVYDIATLLPVVGATVSLGELGLSTTTGTDGRFRFTGLVAGVYTLSAHLDGPCAMVAVTEVEVVAPVTVELILGFPRDDFGYECDPEPGISFVPIGGSALALTGDNTVAQVNLPFLFPFYGEPQDSVWVDTNGILAFEDPGGSHRRAEAIPNSAGPNALIAAYWADLVVDSQASVRAEFAGAVPQRSFSIEWRNVRLKGHPNTRLSVQVTLYESGHVLVNYSGLENALERGQKAVVGIESFDGHVGIQYSNRQAVLSTDKLIAFVYPDLSGVGADLPSALAATDFL